MTISAGAHYVDADYSAICVSGGGGGWGDPLDREIKSIERDLEYEYISENEAKEQYGIIINSNTGKIDYKLTEENRKNIVGLDRSYVRYLLFHAIVKTTLVTIAYL